MIKSSARFGSNHCASIDSYHLERKPPVDCGGPFWMLLQSRGVEEQRLKLEVRRSREARRDVSDVFHTPCDGFFGQVLVAPQAFGSKWKCVARRPKRLLDKRAIITKARRCVARALRAMLQTPERQKLYEVAVAKKMQHRRKSKNKTSKASVP